MWEPGDGWKHRCLTTPRTSRFWTRPEYFPVFFVTPLESNEKAVGFDLASNAVRLAALCEAADTGEVRLTARIKLVQDEESQNAFLAFGIADFDSKVMSEPRSCLRPRPGTVPIEGVRPQLRFGQCNGSGEVRGIARIAHHNAA